MKIRKFEKQDKEIFIQFATELYHTDSVSHAIPQTNIQRGFTEILSDSPYIDGFLMLQNDVPAGYALICYSYSMEAGGMLAILDELYIAPTFQGKGLGKEFLRYMKEHLSEGIKAFRLEFVSDKENLRKLYEKNGFKLMDYTPMIHEM